MVQRVIHPWRDSEIGKLHQQIVFLMDGVFRFVYLNVLQIL